MSPTPSPPVPPPPGVGSPAPVPDPAVVTPAPGAGPHRPPPARGRKPAGFGRAGVFLLALPLAALVGVAVWYGLRGPTDDLGRMQGDWAIKGADGRDRGFVRIEGDRWTYHSGGQERASHRITLNPDASPKEIDLTALEPDGRAKTFTRGATGVEMKELGVYALADGELRVAKAPAWNGGTRPAKLDDPDGPPALTLVRATR